MRFTSRTTLALAAVAATLVPAANAVAVPVHDVGTSPVAALPPVASPRIAAALHHPAVVTASPRTSAAGSGGVDTAAALLLAAGALLAGAGMGFGGARVHATRGTLHPN